jgi:tetratricopeptide (TPR) repeat protein
MELAVNQGSCLRSLRCCKAIAALLLAAIQFPLLVFPSTGRSGGFNSPQDFDQVQILFHQGKFSDVIEQCETEIVAGAAPNENWFLLKIKSEIAIGEYADAKATVDFGLEKLPNSILLRWIGSAVYDFNNDHIRSAELKDEIGTLWNRNSWRYRDTENLVTVGRYLLTDGVDAKRVLDEFYAKARDQKPAMALSYLAIGDLALEKNDFELAAANFTKAVELAPTDPECHLGLAHAWRPSVPEKATEALNQALQINPNHIGALLLIVEQQMSAEEYDTAQSNIEKILDVNPHQAKAWAFRAVIAHLNNDPIDEGKCRSRALEFWRHSPRVDHLIGQELSRKYRFQEGSVYQRRALVFEPGFLPAKIQLAHDLLRLGQELEGWKLASEVFDADQYNVVANNLVALRDNLSQFATLERNGFVVRMDRLEAAVYGELVLRLLDEAREKLAGKYAVELQTPIFIEIFPRQQDFAIRTFGLPGGAGFLGVCFGRVVTMNSPAAQGASLTNWRSILWHEFCHVVTLQKTNNRMPRWLSEGISVYEEQLADDAWGDSINPRYRELILAGELTPVSQLSSAFLSPKSPVHLRFAYYESSLVVRFLIEEFGEQALVDLLDDLSIGTPINDALRRHAAPTDFLDKKFEQYAIRIANELAATADWTKPEDPITDSSGWALWLERHPDNIFGLLGRAETLLKEKQYEQSLEAIDRFNRLYPETKGAEDAFRMRAEAYRNLGNTVAETESLEKVLALDADDVASCIRLLEIYSAASSWDNVIKVSGRMQGINPMLRSSHHFMAMAAEKTGDDSLAIRSLSALVSLNPFDRADVYFRLASAQFRERQLQPAKRNVLLALEAAPRFRDAHRLLLEIVAAVDKPDRQDNSQENGEHDKLKVPEGVKQ